MQLTQEEQSIISNFISNSIQTNNASFITETFLAIMKNDQDTLSMIRENVKTYLQNMKDALDAEIAEFPSKVEIQEGVLNERLSLLNGLIEKI